MCPTLPFLIKHLTLDGSFFCDVRIRYQGDGSVFGCCMGRLEERDHWAIAQWSLYIPFPAHLTRRHYRLRMVIHVYRLFCGQFSTATGQTLPYILVVLFVCCFSSFRFSESPVVLATEHCNINYIDLFFYYFLFHQLLLVSTCIWSVKKQTIQFSYLMVFSRFTQSLFKGGQVFHWGTYAVAGVA